MKLLPFNVNEYIRIRLKPRGREIYRNYWAPAAATLCRDELPESMRPDEDGWLTIQLHAAMKIFGPHIGPCIDGLPFEATIHLVLPEPR